MSVLFFSIFEQSTGSNRADDCNNDNGKTSIFACKWVWSDFAHWGHEAFTEWYPSVDGLGGYDGYVMFGTPEQVIYGNTWNPLLVYDIAVLIFLTLVINITKIL